MRPVSVRFCCFGPYLAEQFVDFEALEKNGLFLISGETGAGKTTILDAICYALYGRSSGGLRGDLSVMRCKLAEKDEETLTEFVFDSGGKRYQFVRTLKYGRKNLNDTHNCLEWNGEEYVPIFENPKATVVNKKAEELIGLTYDQFRQVIILPQGQFEKLLVSDSVEKEKILVSLFHADRWQRIAEEVYRRAAEQDAALREEKNSISRKLEEYGCSSLDLLREKIQLQTAHQAQLQEEAAAARTYLERCREEKEQALLQDKAFQELRVRAERLAGLEAQRSDFQSEGSLLKQADKAEQIRGVYEASQEARSRKLRAEGQVQQAQREQEIAAQTLAEAEADLHRQEALVPDYEKQKQELVLLTAAWPVYRSLEGKKAAVRDSKKALDTAQKEREAAQKQYREAEDNWQTAVLEQNRAIEDYQHTQMQYLQTIGSVLAAKLVTGEPCPVCGSREHPAPAPQVQEQITDALLERKNRAMTAANTAVSETAARRSQAQQDLDLARQSWDRAAQEDIQARADYENTLAQCIHGIADEAQLEAGIHQLQQQIAAFAQREQAVKQRHQNALAEETAARGKLAYSREELAAARTAYAAQQGLWEHALEQSGLGTEAAFLQANLEPEEKQRRKTAWIRFCGDLERAEQELRQQSALLEGQHKPDVQAVQSALNEAQEQHNTLSNRLVLAQESLKKLQTDEADLTRRLVSYEVERAEAEEDLDFANRLRGRSGVSLQRYVLGVMLTSVTVEANRLLQNIYGGRYRLYRTDEIAGSGRKGGLELEVHDSQNNQRRSVTTLSGGEKFLVALSLAIGLSTVVQAQGSGIRLEAMFIDEGFGSLDRESVYDALEVLQSIRRGSGIVGIISHVEQLAEVIPTRLEITKGNRGSTCQVHC